MGAALYLDEEIEADGYSTAGDAQYTAITFYRGDKPPTETVAQFVAPGAELVVVNERPDEFDANVDIDENAGTERLFIDLVNRESRGRYRARPA
jgi:hypothetical protein